MYKIVTLKANAKEICYLKMHLTPHMYNNHYFEGKCSGNHYFKMHLTPDMYKICYFEGKCSRKLDHFKMSVGMLNMYKNLTLTRLDAQESITIKFPFLTTKYK